MKKRIPDMSPFSYVKLNPYQNRVYYAYAKFVFKFLIPGLLLIGLVDLILMAFGLLK